MNIEFNQLPQEIQEAYIRWEDRDNIISMKKKSKNKYHVRITPLSGEVEDKTLDVWSFYEHGKVWEYEVVHS